MHDVGDDAESRREVRAAQVDDDQVGAVAGGQPAAVGDAEGVVAVARRPRQRLLRRRPPAVLPPHALHEHRRARDLHHVLGHVVAAERDATAGALQRVDARGQPATGGDGGVDGDGGAGGAEGALLLGGHAAAMGGDQPVGQESRARQVLRRQHAARLPHGGDLPPDLVQMHGGQHVELILQLAQAPEQLGRAHVGRPRPNAGEAGLGECGIALEWPRLADRRLRAVPGALAQHQAQPARGHRLGVAVEPGAFLEHERRPAANGLERAQQRHDALLVGSQLRQRQRRQAAGEGWRVRWREILVDAARQHTGEVRVGVGETGEDRAAHAVDELGARVAGADVGRRTDQRDTAVVHGQPGVVVDRAGLVAGHDGGAVDDDRRPHASLAQNQLALSTTLRSGWPPRKRRQLSSRISKRRSSR